MKKLREWEKPMNLTPQEKKDYKLTSTDILNNSLQKIKENATK